MGNFSARLVGFGCFLEWRGFAAAMFCVSLCAQPLWAETATDASTSVAPFHLNIRYESDLHTTSARSLAQTRTNFKAVCLKLGNSLTAGSGIYGYGFARTFSCFDGSKILYSNKDSQLSRWLLVLSDNKDKVELTLYYLFAKGPAGRRQVAKSVLPPSTGTLKILRKRPVLDLVVLDLVSQTPFMRSLDLVADNKSFKARSRPATSKEAVPEPPRSFKIIRAVAKADGLFDIVPIGAADMTEESGGGNYVWKITLPEKLDTADSYWAYNDSDRSKTRSAVRGMLEKKLAPLDLSWGKAAVGFANAFASGYIGVRYGKSIMKGEELYAKSAMTGVFMEWRGGPLEGARFYYDAAVRTEVKDAFGNEFHISWSRPSVGMAFGFDLRGFVDRLDVTPKIGRMNFDGLLPAQSSFDSNVMIPTRFVVQKATSLGLEVGLETHSFRNLTRLWGGYDFAGLGKSDRYTSLRGGLDTYFDLIEFGSSDLSLLLFALGERISLSRKVNTEAEVPTGTGELLKELAYNLGYVGAGFTVSF